MDAQKTTERISEKLRALADLVDEHPALLQFPALFGPRYTQHFGQHLLGGEAEQIDDFAETFGVEVNHFVLGEASQEPGARYTEVETQIDGVQFRFQCRTEDYETATGKTVDNGGAQ
jgi:hypothetical protein